ncbi:MAG: hypothetical protein PHG39_09765 [Acidithiobacillus ferrooxidans]|nr:hypothetical protein [Acidithiobacillus ferrooxidans]MDD5003141.1 hypothetical protein [Acidithiobacillus sp.]MDD5377779.1 hypothetical protein [Acidithiobacillus sp.]MDD5576402.1 hypothetical protein [Acidithiobacillus sp.]
MPAHFVHDDSLLTIPQFSLESKLHENTIYEYIYNGLLFPLAPIKSGTVVRRIPSLLTEFICEITKLSSDSAFKSHFGNIKLWDYYDDFLEEIKNWSENNGAQTSYCNVLPPSDLLPWKSDIAITTPSYVYVQPEVVHDSNIAIYGSIRQFVWPDVPRSMMLQGDLKILYEAYCSSDSDFKSIDIGIGNRVLGPFPKKTGFKQTMYYPNLESLQSAAYRAGQNFPVAIHFAIDILNLKHSIIGDDDGGINYDSATDLINNKLREIANSKDKLDFPSFTNLVYLGALSDRWVPIASNSALSVDNCLSLDRGSVFLDRSQLQDIKKYDGWGAYTIATFKQAKLDRIKLRNYAIMSKFVHYLYYNLSDPIYLDGINKVRLQNYFEFCLDDAQKALSNDVYFCKINKVAGSSKMKEIRIPDSVMKTGGGTPYDLEPTNNDGHGNSKSESLVNLFMQPKNKK